MKYFKFSTKNITAFLLLMILSCESKSHVEKTKLSPEDRNIVEKLMNSNDFKVQSIEKIDSTQNSKKIYYYDDDAFSNSRLEVFSYHRNGQLEKVSEYNSESTNDRALILVAEKKHTYSKESEKIKTQIWRNGKKYGKSSKHKLFNKEGRLIEEKTESKFVDSKEKTDRRNTYKYDIDSNDNIATICKEEYSSDYTPKSFETCDKYQYRNGKITGYHTDHQYYFDQKNRVVKEVWLDKSKKPYFEDLYLYDDEKRTMVYQRYRFGESKFLVTKYHDFYNRNGLIEKKVSYGLSENDTFLPEVFSYFFYNNKNEEIMKVIFLSKSFNGKSPPPL